MSLSGKSGKSADANLPAWFEELVQAPLPGEGEQAVIHGIPLVRDGAILRNEDSITATQDQTRDTFAYKWRKRESFETTLPDTMRVWLVERYGDMGDAAWLFDQGEWPVLLDAGCGAGLSALELFAPVLGKIRYVGADISRAVDVARERFAERGIEGAFLQTDLHKIPLPEESVDVVFSEGVLHHTDSTREALRNVCRYVKPGGRIMFYVYVKKGPVREFTDDYIREKLRGQTPDEAWEALMPLSKLGRTLGALNVEIDVEEEVDLLGIPAGKIDLQRFFYWHVCKAFYRPEMLLEEMNHVNFDWFVPQNAHRQSPEEVRAWLDELGFIVERERLEQSGITCIARKTA